MRLFQVATLFALLFGVLAMASAADIPMPLAGSEWGLAGEAGPHERFVRFSADGKVSGSGGCNGFAGQYRQNGREIAITEIRVTMMLCLDEAVMQKEQEFLGWLSTVKRITATHLELRLERADGTVLVQLVRPDFD